MSRRAKAQPRCVICGITDRVELNHVFGRNHVVWFGMYFCKPDHDDFHERLRAAGMDRDLEYTEDEVERIRRALAINLVVQDMLLERLKHLNLKKRTETERKHDERSAA